MKSFGCSNPYIPKTIACGMSTEVIPILLIVVGLNLLICLIRNEEEDMILRNLIKFSNVVYYSNWIFIDLKCKDNALVVYTIPNWKISDLYL